MDTRIIQSGYTHTGSTLLVNILYGFFCPNKPVFIDDSNLNRVAMLGSKTLRDLPSLITKAHRSDFDLIIEGYTGKYDLYFVVSERDKPYEEHYYKYDNVLLIKYDTLLETDRNPLNTIVKNVYEKLRSFLPQKIFPDIEEKCILDNAVQRIKSMNELYETIKHKPFEYHDNFYMIHGSHRGRHHLHPN